MLGTAEMPVTPRSATARRMSTGIHESRITSVEPATSEAMSWLKPTSKENGSTLKSTSRSESPNHSISVSARSRRSCRPTSTPLGVPVDPEVNRHAAGASGASAGNAMSSWATGQSARFADSRNSAAAFSCIARKAEPRTSHQCVVRTGDSAP